MTNQQSHPLTVNNVNNFGKWTRPYITLLSFTNFCNMLLYFKRPVTSVFVHEPSCRQYLYNDDWNLISMHFCWNILVIQTSVCW